MYNIKSTKNFERDAKPLLKRYVFLKQDLEVLAKELTQNPKLGISLGKDIYKIRLAVKSKNKGKYSGVRLIFFVKIVEENIYLISIYDKAERDTISAKKIEEIMESEDL